jgi:phospholipid transport system substrate-binding protein
MFTRFSSNITASFTSLSRRLVLSSALIAVTGASSIAFAQSAEAPDVLIKRISSEVIESVRTDTSIQAGDLKKVTELVDAKILPHTNFERMTAMAAGRNWRAATPEQQKRLQGEFKQLLIRTYAGAMVQIKDQKLDVKPLRAAAEDTEVVVRSQVIGKGDPIQLDYRMEKTAGGWKVYDLNVLGVWLVESYRNQFQNEITKGGLDGLITTLSDRNKLLAGKKTS